MEEAKNIVDEAKQRRIFERQSANKAQMREITQDIARWSNRNEDFPYTPVKFVGAGGYGMVFMAINERNLETVAIKACSTLKHSKGMYSSPRHVAVETEILHKTEHPNVLHMHTYFETSAFIYIVMPLAEGTLRDVIKQLSKKGTEDESSVYFGMDSERAMNFLRQILEALDYLKEQSIIHRDLKPDNVLLMRGQIKVADFGSAHNGKTRMKFLTDSDGTNSQENGLLTEKISTVWYRAPEMILGKSEYDFKVDLWAAGLIALELMQGSEMFFNCHTEYEILIVIMRDVGKITEKNWPGVSKLPYYADQLPDFEPTDMVKQAGLTGWKYNVVRSLLTPYPPNRATAMEALDMWPQRPTVVSFRSVKKAKTKE